MEVHRVEYGYNREHHYGLGYKPPLDALSSAMDGVEQRGYAL